MSNENLSNNSVDESISALENSGKVKQHSDSLSANQIRKAAPTSSYNLTVQAIIANNNVTSMSFLCVFWS